MMKYPIVLVHGIVVKDTLFTKAFGKIEKILKKEGFIVYSSKTDGFGTIENNAEQLKKQILEIKKIHHVDKVNIIAHSKGGLDSKYMIKNLKMEDSVASLTTLCTPHKGSPIATKLLTLPKWMIKFLAFNINLWYKILGDKKPNALEVCKQLQRVDCIEDESILFSKQVYCQSYSTKMEKSKDDFIMGIPLYFSRKFENIDSDGLVPIDSTVFGEYKGECLNESISHSEIIDFMVNKKKKEKIYHFYIGLCLDLEERGF